MTALDPTHHYSQQAGAETQKAFQLTAGIIIVDLAVMLFTAWWWLLIIAVASAGAFALFLTRRTKVTLLDVNTNKFITTSMSTWKDFQAAHPELVDKAGADQD